MAIVMGCKAKDIVTGYEGIVTGKTEYLTGCIRLLLVPQVKKDGTLLDGEWFDIDRLKVTGVGVKLPNTANGYDKEAPKR